jgi:hypothetical protein
MTDISVEDIIQTFQGVKRAVLPSSAQTDSFLKTLKAKKHWTIDEFKSLSLAFSLVHMRGNILSLHITKIQKKYSFKLDWVDYFNVIENVKNTKKKKEYVNYFFWYYAEYMNEKIYQEFMEKPYAKLLRVKSRIRFLAQKITINSQNLWIFKYFRLIQIQKILNNRYEFYIPRNTLPNKVVLESEVKQFYHQYEQLMNYKTKVKFFHAVVSLGIISLIKFLHQEKNINKLNTVKLLWYACIESSTNTLEILQYFDNSGINLTSQVLKKTQDSGNWLNMGNSQILVDFITNKEREKSYLKLNKKLKCKTKSNTIQKI